MTIQSTLHRHAFSCCSAAIILGALIAPASASESVLYSFQGKRDGYAPSGTLINDKAGNLFGTTQGGGGGKHCQNGSNGCGTIFQITSTGEEIVLHAFAGGCDGAFPRSGPIADKVGNLYGTTQAGGCSDLGIVYKITPKGKESVLYAFQGADDGEGPVGGLATDKTGNLYGNAGGGGTGCGGNGCGLVFKLSPNGGFSVLYSFQGDNDGYGPYGNVIVDKAGNIYGTTLRGGGVGCSGSGCGTVFKITPDGKETVLHAFQDGSDGAIPTDGVVADGTGNLYGTTSTGGAPNSGTVFKIAPDGTETVLYAFQNGPDGAFPEAGVTLDKQSNIYGTTSAGGNQTAKGCKRFGGCGIVFKVTPDGTKTTLVTFDGTNGANPYGGLLLGKQGMLYGTTTRGGDKNKGIVFQVKK